VSGLKVRSAVRDGRVRGSVKISPEDTAAKVTVKEGQKRIGHTSVRAAAGRTRFAVRLKQSALERASIAAAVYVKAPGVGTAKTVDLRVK
jgi:hypothetical protein